MGDDWADASLGSVVKIKHGFAFQSTYFTDDQSADILLTPGNVEIGGGFKAEKLKFYKGPVPDGFVLSIGDVVVTMTDLSKDSDTLGFPACVPAKPHGQRFLHNQRLGKVEVIDKSKVDVRFIYYLMCSRDYRNEVLAGATGTTVKHTSPERIMQFRFHLPLLSEQRDIAQVLGTLDQKIALARRMNQTIEQVASAVFESWFVDFHPIRAKATGVDDGLPIEVQSAFPSQFDIVDGGEVPAGWTLAPLHAQYRLTMGQSPPGESYNDQGEGLPFFQGRSDFSFRFPAKRIFCTNPTRFAELGDTLVSVRAPVGDINMADGRCCIGRGVAAVRHISGARSFTYYSMLALREELKHFEADGTVFGAINKDSFRNILCLRPSEVSVAAFESFIHHLDDEIENNEKEIQSLAKLRNELLPRLITGKVRYRSGAAEEQP